MSMDYDWYELTNLCSDLSEYSALDGPTSETEATDALCGLISRPDYISDELLEVAIKEAREKLEHYKKNTRIVKSEETFTRSVTELEWIDE